MAARTSSSNFDEDEERLLRWLVPALDLADEAAKGYSLDSGSPTTDFATVAALLGQISLVIVRRFSKLARLERPVTFDAEDARPTFEIGVKLGTRESSGQQIPVILATRLRMSDHFDILKNPADATELLMRRLVRDGASPPPLLALDFQRFKAVFRGLVELLDEAARDLPVSLGGTAHPGERSRALVTLAQGYDTVADVMRS